MKEFIVFVVFMTAACSADAGLWARAQGPAKPGRAIHRPASSAADPERTVELQYVVKKGDTLFQIAARHRTTVAALKSINQLSSNRLRIGQKLRFRAPKTAAGKQSRTSLLTKTIDEAVASPPVPAFSDDSSPVMSALDEESAAAPSDAGLDSANAEYATLPLRMRLAGTGLDFLGARYRWTGTSESSGFDCSGFVKHLFEKFNISLPRSSREQYKVGEKIDKGNLEVGDLVFFSSRGKTPTHVGVYLGDNMFLHAARKAREVIVSNLTGAWYSRRFLGARRLLDLWEPESKPADTKSH